MNGVSCSANVTMYRNHNMNISFVLRRGSFEYNAFLDFWMVHDGVTLRLLGTRD
jgi:hypothetical protein